MTRRMRVERFTPIALVRRWRHSFAEACEAIALVRRQQAHPRMAVVSEGRITSPMTEEWCEVSAPPADATDDEPAGQQEAGVAWRRRRSWRR